MAISFLWQAWSLDILFVAGFGSIVRDPAAGRASYWLARRSGGPKVPSSNLGSPTPEIFFSKSSRLTLEDFSHEFE